MELISEREAARRLAGSGLSLSATQHLLATGLGGRPVRTAVATLYDAAMIDELACRRDLSYDETKALMPDGAVVVRLPRGRRIIAEDRWPATDAVLRGPWPVPPGPTMAILDRHWAGKTVPLLLTVSGFVISGATIVDFTAEGARGRFGVCFVLEGPGTWLDGVSGRRLAFGRGATVELLGDLAWVRKNRTGRSAERARR